MSLGGGDAFDVEKDLVVMFLSCISRAVRICNPRGVGDLLKWLVLGALGMGVELLGLVSIIVEKEELAWRCVVLLSEW